MKIRNGFVTNSSSSSFIVAFDELPENKEQLQKMLFGDNEFFTKYDYTISCKNATDSIWDNMVEKEHGEAGSEYHWFQWKAIDVFDIARELSSGHIDERPGLYNYKRNEWGLSYDGYNPKYVKGKLRHEREDGTFWEHEDIDLDLLQKDEREWGYNKAEELYDANPNTTFFLFEYSDNDGQFGAVMEHGGVFEGLGEGKSFRISHH